MSTLARDLESYKLDSRDYRNQGLKALKDGSPERAAAEFERAAVVMREAIRYLGELGQPDPAAGAPPTEGEAEVAKELADCWGILGGVYRAQGDLANASAAYDRGFAYESGRRFNILSSYNLVNRLVVRILQRPGLLSAPPPPVGDVAGALAKTMPELLREAAVEIERQIRDGRKDRTWAQADLVMVRLLGGLEGVDAALAALEDATTNDPFPTHSMLKVIRELAQKDLPRKDQLLAVGERLRERLPESMRGEPLVDGLPAVWWSSGPTPALDRE